MLDQEYVNNIPITIDPSMDLAFKNLFGMKESKSILIDFLNNILKRNNKEKIIEIKFLNKEPTGTNVIKDNNKKKRGKPKKKKLELMKPEENDKTISIGATIKTGEIINIEIQMYEDPEMFKKSLFYASGIIFRSLPPGKKYNHIPNVIMLNILKFNIFNHTEKKKNKLNWMFTLKENEMNEEKGFKNLLNIHFIELKNFDDYTKENIKDMRKNYPWILFLNNPNDNFFKKMDTPKEFIKARKQLIYLQSDPEFMELYDARSKALSDENSRKDGNIKIGIKIGEERGIKIGEEIGEERGIKVTKIEIALSLLKDKFKKESVMELTKLSKEIVDILKDFLDNPDLTKFETIKSKLKIDQNNLNKICENLEISINEKVPKKRKVN